jgi:lipopolysaccharide export system protein LptA
MSRRRGWEILVLLFGAVFLALIVYSFRPGRRPASGRAGDAVPSPPSAQDGGQPMTVSQGFDYTETVGGKPIFRIQSERTVGFGAAAGLVPNVYALESVALTLYPDRGSPVTVRAEKAQYDHRTNEAVLSGNVRWTDEKGAIGETAKLEFHPAAHALTAPGAIHFARGTFNITARSGRYDVPKHELTLTGPLNGSGTGEGSGGLSELAADGAVYRRDEGVIELAGNVSGSSKTGDRIACERLVLKTEQEGNRFEWARAVGNVRGALVSQAGGPPAGTAHASAGERRYTADQGLLLFAPEGAVRSLSLSGKPAHVEQGDRKVDAEGIDVDFTAGRASAARARGHVRMDSPQNHAESENASLSFSPAGEIETLELAGAVAMQGDGRSARGEKAVEVPARGAWILTGGAGSSATVESEGSRVSGARIELDKTRRTLDAQGNARAVFVPGKTQQNAPTLVGDSSRPTYGKATRIVVDDASHVATLSGGATLWQGASSLYGDDITLNDAERTLVAVGHTRTVISPEPAPGETRPAADRVPSVVTARRVIYREAEGTALFEGEVAVTRGGRRATAQKATAILSKDRKIERVELTGDVSLADVAGGRTGKAERAVDWPPLDKTVLEGSPAWVTDAEGNRVAGATLTITEGGRRVEVTAPDGGKTETIHKTKKN